jgi:hypothetical protein
MALYIPHSIFHLARLLYVRPENFGPHYVKAISFEGVHKIFIYLIRQLITELFN